MKFYTGFNAEKNEKVVCHQCIQLNSLKSKSESTNRKWNVLDGQVNFTQQTLSSCSCQGVMELYFCSVFVFNDTNWQFSVELVF